MSTDVVTVYEPRHPQRRMGRAEAPPRLIATMPRAPRVLQGAIPNKSPDIIRFDPAIPWYQRRGFCFPSGTPILMANGLERPIEDVGVGNMVMTHNGRARRVTELIPHRFTGMMYSVRVKGWGWPLRMTADHPIAVVDDDGVDLRWIKAEDLRIGQWVLMSRGPDPSHEIPTIDVRDYVDEECWTDQDRCRTVTSKNSTAIRWRVRVDERFARLVGFYLAEGGLRRSSDGLPRGIAFTFNRDERDYAVFVADALEAIFGVQAQIIEPTYKDSITIVRCDGATIGHFFQSFCGHTIYTKLVNRVFYTAPAPIRMALLRAWMHGDGHRSPILRTNAKGVAVRKLQAVGVSVSHQLIRDFFRISLSLGMKPAAKLRKQAAHQNAQAGTLEFFSRDVVKLYPDIGGEVRDFPFKGRHYKPHDVGFMCRIESIDRYAVAGLPVYNFEVSEDHSYVANGIVAHNCVGWTLAMVGQIVLKIPPDADSSSTPLETIRLSPIYAYDVSRMQARQDGINLGGGDGSIVSSALKAVDWAGYVRWESDPGDPQHEDSHRNGTVPTQAQQSEGKQHLGQHALCDSLDHGLEMMGAGYPLDFGSSIPQGFMNTSSDGWITMTGRVVGGHSYRGMAYDLDQDLLVLGNNWPQWGWRDTSPRWAACNGYTNLAKVKLSEFRKYFTDRMVQSGQSEIGVVSSVRGWVPLLYDYSGF